MELPGERKSASEPRIPAISKALPSSNRLQGIRWSYHLRGWLGLLPFLLFCLLFELLPAVIIIEGSFTDSNTGALTLNNYQRMLSQTQNLHAFQTSISLSLVTALVGAVFGFLAAYGVYSLRTGWLHHFLIGFSSITANFAGVPLAFAFVATLGVNGFITVAIHNWLHVNLYDIGFNLYTFGGLVLVYSYFQLPLMMLVTIPALNGLRPEWREAATNLGASGFTYWRRVALPILMPSLIAATMLLFANAFGAYATAFALAGGAINLVPILIGFVVAGNVGIDTGLGNALAVGMIVVLLVAVSLHTVLVRRASVWRGN
jgi:putative spermidine/putrescine transport system permease protein